MPNISKCPASNDYFSKGVLANQKSIFEATVYTRNPQTDNIEKWRWVLIGKSAELIYRHIQNLQPFDRILLCVNDEDKFCEGYATSPSTLFLQEQGYDKRMVLSPTFSDTKVHIHILFSYPCFLSLILPTSIIIIYNTI